MKPDKAWYYVCYLKKKKKNKKKKYILKKKNSLKNGEIPLGDPTFNLEGGVPGPTFTPF